MSTTRSFLSLRNILYADAATCAAMGALLVAGSSYIAGLTQLPSGLLFYAGSLLFPIAVFMAVIASRPVIPLIAVWLIIGGNVLWVAVSFGLLIGAWIDPNIIGFAFITAQALAVAVLAKLEHGALSSV